MEAEIKRIPNVKTNLLLLNFPKVTPGPIGVGSAFLEGSPFLRKVLVLGELVAMYSIQIRF